jgi:hypothetical protein
VTLIDDGGPSDNVFLNLSLVNPANGVSPGSQTTAVLWIVD